MFICPITALSCAQTLSNLFPGFPTDEVQHIYSKRGKEKRRSLTHSLSRLTNARMHFTLTWVWPIFYVGVLLHVFHVLYALW